MFYISVYILIISELLFTGIFYFLQWKQYHKRKSDISTGVVYCILAVSYIFYAITFAQVDTKLVQLIIDFTLALYLGWFFLHKAKEQLKKTTK